MEAPKRSLGYPTRKQIFISTHNKLNIVSGSVDTLIRIYSVFFQRLFHDDCRSRGHLVVLGLMCLGLVGRNHFQSMIDAFAVREVFLAAICAYQEKAVLFVLWMTANLKYDVAENQVGSIENGEKV